MRRHQKRTAAAVALSVAALMILQSEVWASFPVVVFTAALGKTYALTAGEGATCTPVAEGMECEGPHGRASAYANGGCGRVEGSAFCLVVPPGWQRKGGTQPEATSTLECNNGKSYELSTGTPAGACTANNGQEMKCTDGQNSTSASCDNGCGETTGAASCKVTKK